MEALALSGQFVATKPELQRPSSCKVFTTVSPNLVVLGESCQGVRHRHLAGFVALQPHFFQDLASGKSVTVPDYAQELISLATTPAGSTTTLTRTSLLASANLLALEHIELGEHLVQLIKLILKHALLIQELFTLIDERFPLPRDKRLGFS